MTKRLTTSAVLLALGIVLTIFYIYRLTNGGCVTMASMLPVAVISLLYPTWWGLMSAAVFSLLQMMVLGGVTPPPTQDVYSYIMVILLDYLIASGVLGLTGPLYRLMRRKIWAIPTATAVVLVLNFLCHYVSGVIIWGVYAKPGQSPALYSLIYNGSYMLPEILITTTVAAFLSKFLQRRIGQEGA